MDDGFYYDEIYDFDGTVHHLPMEAGLPLIWDKKRFSFEKCIDLKDIALYFKIKDFSDLACHFPDEYANFAVQKNKMDGWISSFSYIPEHHSKNLPGIPSRMALQFLRARRDILALLWEKAHFGEASRAFLEYYRNAFGAFDAVRKMDYEIKTARGVRRVNLCFAENFRFKTMPESFNLFNMKKEYRNVVIPQSEDEFIYAIDFRQFEFRTFLRLVDADVDFEEGNIYECLGERLGLSLSDVKVKLISYIYSEAKDENIQQIADKDKLDVSGEYFFGGAVPVFLGCGLRNKKIHSAIQTISYFHYLERLELILRLLDNKKSKFIFPLHDAMIFSISKDELFLLDEIPKLLEDDTYKIKQYIGKNYLEIEEI